MTPTPTELRERLLAQYNRCKDFPEKTEGGRIALIEIRNMVPDLDKALERLETFEAEWIEIERLRLGKRT